MAHSYNIKAVGLEPVQIVPLRSIITVRNVVAAR